MVPATLQKIIFFFCCGDWVEEDQPLGDKLKTGLSYTIQDTKSFQRLHIIEPPQVRYVDMFLVVVPVRTRSREHTHHLGVVVGYVPSLLLSFTGDVHSVAERI